MADKFTTDDVRTTTTQAERGEDVRRVLEDMPISERVNFTRAMQAQNREDRRADAHLPALEFTYGRDGSGQETVVRGSRVSDPGAVVFRGSTQIYDGKPASGSSEASPPPRQVPQGALGSGGLERAAEQLRTVQERDRRAGA